MPVTYSTVSLNEAQMQAIGLKNNIVRTMSLQYIEDGTTVKTETMRWQLINISLGKTIGSKDLEARMDSLTEIIGSVSSGGVTTVENDFLAIGITLATAAGIDLPFLKLQLVPTKDPTVFKGMVYLGLNNFENDNVSGVAADSKRSYDADYFPSSDAVKGILGKGLGSYIESAADQVAEAGKQLKNNVRSGSGQHNVKDRKISYALQGYFETEVFYNFSANKWEMLLVNGGFTAGGGGFEYTWNTQVGPVPVFLQLEAGAAAAVEFRAAVDHTQKANDYLTELRIYAYLQAYGGVGFDYAVIALKLGLYGRVGMDATLRWLDAIGQNTQFSSKVAVTGEIGVKFQIELLFLSYEKILWSQPINVYNYKSSNWNKVETYWNDVKNGNSGNGEIFAPPTNQLRATLVASNGDMGIYAAEGDATLLDRDYLTQYKRSYDSAGPVPQSSSAPALRQRSTGAGGSTSLLSRLFGRSASNIVATLDNAYSLASPALSDDGQYLFYLDDGANAADATHVRAAVMTKNGSGGYNKDTVIDDSGYGDNGLHAAGSGEKSVAVWSRVTSKPAITEPGQSVTPDVQADMINQSDIMVAVRSGAAAVTFTLQTGEHDAANGSYRQEIAYAVVDKTADGAGDYDVTRYVQMTNDKNLDENPQITSVELDGADHFVLGWHCLNAESGQSDICLAAVDKNGDRVTGFVDSLSSLIQNSDVGVSPNFQFAKNAATLNELSILWSETSEEGGDTGEPVHDYLSALRFRTENEQGRTRISVTSAQKLVELNKWTAIDNFNAYVGSGGALYAVLQGTYYDYDNLQTYTVSYGDGSTGSVSVASDKTSIYTVAGVYTDTLRVDSVLPDYRNIRKGTSLPVQLSVTNLGTQPMTKVEVEIGGQPSTFAAGAGSAFPAIAPGETRSLTAYYLLPADAIPDPTYTVTGTFADGSTHASDVRMLVLNIPDLGIARSDILVDAVNGDRILQFNLYNLSDAELAGSGRSVKLGLYSDAACTEAIDPQYLTLTMRSGAGLLTVNDKAGLAAIDEGSYTIQYTLDLEQYIKDNAEFADNDGEIRDGGVTVYAKAWVELPGNPADGTSAGEMLEYVSSNNVAAVQLESLLKQADGAPITAVSTLDNSGDSSTVGVALQNNSLFKKTTGNLLVALLDDKGNVLEQQQSYTGRGADKGLITLNAEERTTPKTFTFSQRGAAARVFYTDAVLDNAKNTALSSVRLEGFDLTYDEATKTYSGTSSGLSDALLTILPEDPNATITVNDTPYDRAVKQALYTGPNAMTIVVTAADQTTTETYQLKVANGSSSDDSSLSYAGQYSGIHSARHGHRQPEKRCSGHDCHHHR
ncbi:MAG: cadherin-like beta sandwich domain-containing protein [Agathobaculum sp.]|uniref:cadherin-like beta sandwich domain-containing protein n=1 Tax=Agathobaculum sp. TaxID=2048138 RepID=UPI002A83ADC4|nr:cadherin-like beta sandwich domain-containing protein [Agathobaculum sp.]MDY3712079.1 cadherin-like beta sandwich domain-containing protein [Agathobaculum sp.]